MKKLTTSALALAFGVAAPALALAATTQHHAARSGSSVAPVTKAQAIREIQMDGYTNVQDVRAEKGGWAAKAQEGGNPVSLSVDSIIGVRKQ